MFVGAFNEAGGESAIGVTLWVGGSIVSGELISRSAFFAGVADMMRTRPNTEAFVLAFDKFAKDAAEEDSQTAEGESESRIGYIHLRNARTFNSGNPIPANQGVWWRGRMESVDAWSFGLLAVAS